MELPISSLPYVRDFAEVKNLKFCVEAAPFEKKMKYMCFFTCGKQCMKCGPTAYLKLSTPGIQGVHSSWITPNILAMQRPNDNLIEGDTRLLQHFAEVNITSIFNLTEPGEHPYCGSELRSSGFPYSPEKFMAAGIKHFNYSWKDLTVPSFSLIMDVVQIARTELSAGSKIAVHCHAGFGRTGLAIACMLIAHFNMSSKDAILTVRKNRKGSIQTSAQEAFITAFETKYDEIRRSFPKSSSRIYSINQSTINQQHFLSSTEISSRIFRYRNKILCGIFQNMMTCISIIEDQTAIIYNIIGAATKIVYDISDADVTKDYFARMKSIKRFMCGILALSRTNSDGASQVLVNAFKQKELFETDLETCNPTEVASSLRCSVLLIKEWFQTRSDGLFSNEILNKIHSEIFSKRVFAPDDSAAIVEIQSQLICIFESDLSKYKLQLLGDVLVILVQCFQYLEQKGKLNEELFILYEIFLVKFASFCYEDDLFSSEQDVEKAIELALNSDLALNWHRSCHIRSLPVIDLSGSTGSSSTTTDIFPFANYVATILDVFRIFMAVYTIADSNTSFLSMDLVDCSIFKSLESTERCSKALTVRPTTKIEQA